MAADKKGSQKKVHFLKRRVYHDRYFAYTISLLIIAGIALVSYVVIAGKLFNPNAAFSVPGQPDKYYINSQYGYSVSYPSTWVLEVSPDTVTPAGLVSFENPASSEEGFSVIPANAKDSAKALSQLHVQTEKDTIDGAGDSVKLITVLPSSDLPLYQLAFISGSGKYFIVNGSDASLATDFSKFIHGFKITQ